MHGQSIWEFADTIPSTNDPILRKRTYLIYLRLLIFLVRNLPFSDDENCYTKVKNVKISGAATVRLQTKKELLLSIWLTGKISPVCFITVYLIFLAVLQLHFRKLFSD